MEVRHLVCAWLCSIDLSLLWHVPWGHTHFYNISCSLLSLKNIILNSFNITNYIYKKSELFVPSRYKPSLYTLYLMAIGSVEDFTPLVLCLRKMEDAKCFLSMILYSII